jgi:hypothetical protein
MRKRSNIDDGERPRVRLLRERRAAVRARHLSRPADEDDDDEIEEWSGSSPEEELLDALERIEEARRELEAQRRYFEAVLAADDYLQEQWAGFLRHGGISAHEFRNYLAGKIIRYRANRKRRHLRLIVNNKRRAVRAPNGGDEAA